MGHRKDTYGSDEVVPQPLKRRDSDPLPHVGVPPAKHAADKDCADNIVGPAITRARRALSGAASLRELGELCVELEELMGGRPPARGLRERLNGADSSQRGVPL